MRWLILFVMSALCFGCTEPAGQNFCVYYEVQSHGHKDSYVLLNYRDTCRVSRSSDGDVLWNKSKDSAELCKGVAASVEEIEFTFIPFQALRGDRHFLHFYNEAGSEFEGYIHPDHAASLMRIIGPRCPHVDAR